MAIFSALPRSSRNSCAIPRRATCEVLLDFIGEDGAKLRRTRANLQSLY